MKTMNKSIFTLTPIAVGMLTMGMLAGCNDIDQDVPSDEILQLVDNQFNGIAAEGYLANSTVFFDNNNNGALDPWEPSAYTDSDGYLSYNPLTETDYCAANASDVDAQYCLQTKQAFDSIIMRINGGISSTSIRPIGGQLSRKINNVTANSNVTPVISPFTSLLTHTPDAQQAALLALMDLTPELLDLNYLNLPIALDDGSEVQGIYTALAGKAILIHKLVVVVNDYIDSAYPDLGTEMGMPYDASNAIYKRLSSLLLGYGLELETAIAHEPLVLALIDEVETDVRDIYQEFDIVIPSGLTPAIKQAVATGVVALPGAIEYIQALPMSDLASIKSFMKVIDEVVWQYLDEQSGSNRVAGMQQRSFNLQQQLDNLKKIFQQAIGDVETVDITIQGSGDNLVVTVNEAQLQDEVIDTTNNFTVGDLVNSLGITVASDDDADVKLDNLAINYGSTQLNIFVTDANTLQDSIDTLPTFDALAGKTIKISDDDLGPPSAQNDREVEMYFQADGQLSVCAKKVEDYAGGELDIDDFWGKYGQGSWSVVGDDKRTLSIIYEVEEGANLQGYFSMLPKEVVDGVEKFAFKGAFSASDGNQSSIFYSEQGILDVAEDGTTVPTSDAACEARLGRRINQ